METIDDFLRKKNKSSPHKFFKKEYHATIFLGTGVTGLIAFEVLKKDLCYKYQNAQVN